jgi:hypothetical protein
MAWAKASITLAAAHHIFGDRVRFEVIDIQGKPVGYRAVFAGWALEDTSLTQLCKTVVNKLIPDATPSTGIPVAGYKPWPTD